jgi:uncharacterized iron-regulated protein
MINQDELTAGRLVPQKKNFAPLMSICLALIMCGCAMSPKKLMIKDSVARFTEGTIISARTRGPVSYDEFVADLKEARFVYIGEIHTAKSHHDIQLKIIKDLYSQNPNIAVGMEMFDRTYQHILNEWTKGSLDRKTFINKTHWYANWKYDFDLYSDIFEFLKENKIRIVGLNVPFHISPKIATGGIESLSCDEKKHLPENIDTSNTARREYVEEVFKMHSIKGRDNFNNFYMAHSAWDETMAETAFLNVKNDVMIVLAGNGHIFRFGIPERVFARNHLPFRNVFLAPAGSTADISYVDYIWVTAPLEKRIPG